RRPRRRGLRPLPPLPGRRAADARAGPAELPLQRELGARAARGHRTGQRAGFGLLLAAGRRAAGKRHRAERHAVPLGPAGRAGRPRRLAKPRQRALVRRIRRDHVLGAGRPRAAVDHAQRAVGGGRWRLPARRAGAGPPQPLRGADRRAQPDARQRRGHPGLSCARPARDLRGIQHRAQVPGFRQRGRSRRDADALPLRAAPVHQPHRTHTETGWEVYEQGLVDMLTGFRRRYGDIPLYITENGAAFYDPPVVEGEVLDDPLRTDYLRRHLVAAHRAIKAGVDLRGYYAWSLLDNLEWSLGYAKRFGLYHVDFATQRRTPKASAKLYARVIASHGEALGEA